MKKLVALIMTVILIVGAIFMVGCGNSNSGDQTANNGGNSSSNNGSDQTQQVTTYPGVRSVRLSMGALSETEATTTSTGEETEAYSERVIIATILPTSALQKVDYTMTWQSNGSSEGIDEYLTLRQESDGSPKAIVRCTKDFSANGAILITATARSGGLSDTITATFEGVTREIDLIPVNTVDGYLAEKVYSESRGDYFELKNSFQYFKVELTSFYGTKVEMTYGDYEFSGSDSYVFVKTSLENLMDNEIILRIRLKEFAESLFYEDDFSESLTFYINFAFFDGYDLSQHPVTCAGGGSLGDSNVRLYGIGGDLNENQYYTIVDYDLAVVNSSIDDAVIDTCLGSEVFEMSEDALNEAYYEIIITDNYAKLTKTFRLWGRVLATSVDAGSDIVF